MITINSILTTYCVFYFFTFIKLIWMTLDGTKKTSYPKYVVQVTNQCIQDTCMNSPRVFFIFAYYEWEIKLAIILGLIHHVLHKKMPVPWQLLSIRLMSLSFWSCNLIKDFPFLSFPRSSVFLWFYLLRTSLLLTVCAIFVVKCNLFIGPFLLTSLN